MGIIHYGIIRCEYNGGLMSVELTCTVCPVTGSQTEAIIVVTYIYLASCMQGDTNCFQISYTLPEIFKSLKLK